MHIISTKTTPTHSTVAKKSIKYIVITTLHTHVSVPTAVAIFVDIFNTFGTTVFKSHAQKARKMCQDAIKNVYNMKIMLCISVK